MGKIITIASQKGGVGKTTAVLNMGYSLSRLGKKVLMVDADPQGGLGISTNLKKRTSQGLVSVLRGKVSIKNVIIPSRDKTMSVIGSGVTLAEDTIFLEQSARSGLLGKVLRLVEKGYDYILVDAPTGIGIIAAALLSVSTSVIIPVSCKTLSATTIASFLRLVHRVRKKDNTSLRFNGVFFNMFDAAKETERHVFQEMTGAFPATVFFKTVIPIDERFETAAMKSIPAGMLPDGQDAGRSYLDLAMEFKDRELKDQVGGDSDDEIVEGLF
jgi:chromosome partitioning protein